MLTFVSIYMFYDKQVFWLRNKVLVKIFSLGNVASQYVKPLRDVLFVSVYGQHDSLELVLHTNTL